VDAALCISASATDEQKQVGLKFLEFISRPENAQLWSDTDGAPSCILGTTYSDTRLSPITDKAATGVVCDWYGSKVTTQVTNEIYNVVQGLLLDGDLDAYIAGLDEAIESAAPITLGLRPGMPGRHEPSCRPDFPSVSRDAAEPGNLCLVGGGGTMRLKKNNADSATFFIITVASAGAVYVLLYLQRRGGPSSTAPPTGTGCPARLTSSALPIMSRCSATNAFTIPRHHPALRADPGGGNHCAGRAAGDSHQLRETVQNLLQIQFFFPP
jgi:hypothetical protein